MKLPSWLTTPPTLTKSRVRLAYGTAVTIDALQFIAGPVGWVLADEVLDVIGMALTWRLLGFHPLLLPTFALEFVPVADMLPSWTACVALVIAQRKRQQAIIPPDDSKVIDVEAKRVD